MIVAFIHRHLGSTHTGAGTASSRRMIFGARVYLRNGLNLRFDCLKFCIRSISSDPCDDDVFALHTTVLPLGHHASVTPFRTVKAGVKPFADKQHVLILERS